MTAEQEKLNARRRELEKEFEEHNKWRLAEFARLEEMRRDVDRVYCEKVAAAGLELDKLFHETFHVAARSATCRFCNPAK